MHYNPALDGLRALSILAIVLFHCNVPGLGGGFVGLDVFFVLSGYLITSLLLAESGDARVSVGRFYARRALRLYPTLLLMLATYVVLAPVLWPAENRWLSAALGALYAWDYAMAFWRLPFTVAHTWSLGVEAKFYLLWPLLLPLLLQTRRPLAWLVAGFIAVTAWRYAIALTSTWQQAYFRFDTRMSGILLGAVGALARPRMSAPVVAVACIALAVDMIVPSLPSLDQTRGVTLSITLAELAAFVLVCHAGQLGEKSRFLASRPMAYIGRMSYGIFVWHFPVVALLATSQPTWVTVSAALLFAFPMAIICWHWVDVPVRRWYGRVWPVRPGFGRAEAAANR